MARGTVARAGALAGAVAAIMIVAWLGAAPLVVAADHEIAIRSDGFDPPTITVLTGEPVTWTNASSADHTVTSDDGQLDSGPIGPGEAYGHVFDVPGTIRYHDASGGFTGTVVVEAAPVTPRPSGPVGASPPPGTLPPDFSPLPAPTVGAASAGPSAKPGSSSADTGGVPPAVWLLGLLIAAAAAFVLVRRTRRPGR